ncbi:hypothetical protein HC031_14660 [Planosporangium thailandense]|uniref:HIRAN domain-containing protein n=1 Tax=Planosporangium thailandense TaxID=765197 RepID=A0ABX0Y0F2_9ACTN|nr:hypothetical protein [Planosporangium thailandense]
MSFIDRILGRPSTETDMPEPLPNSAPGSTPDGRWYVPHDGDRDRFVGADGVPPLHLIVYGDTGGESVLRLCEDTTGLLVSPSDTRLPRAGIYVSQLRGEAYHRTACEAGDFRPGRPVRLVREPDNEFDRNAVAVYDHAGLHPAAYVNKQKARMLSRLMDSGEPIEAISIRGTGSGIPCDQIAVLAASPEVLRRLLEPRPDHLPTPAHQVS